jgi:MinD-like ATPase involved in chromosome partitioning or flagellar assembly
MPVISVIATKRSPGSTSIALIISSLLKAYYEDSVFLEADPAGGDLALRFQRSSRPGLITLAAERKSITAELLNDHCQLFKSLKIIFGTQGYEQFALVDKTLKETVDCCVKGNDSLMVVDLGRWIPGIEVSKALLKASECVVLVVDNSPGGIVSARSILGSINNDFDKPNVLICSTGLQTFEISEVESFLKHDVIGVIDEPYKVSELLLEFDGSLVKIKTDQSRALSAFQEHLLLSIGKPITPEIPVSQELQHTVTQAGMGKEASFRNRFFKRGSSTFEELSTKYIDEKDFETSDGGRSEFDENELMELVEE